MKALLDKGITILHPESTYIDTSIDPERIHESVVIHPGSRITGATTSIGPDCVIGEESAATVDECQLASSVRLKGGYFAGSVFMDSTSIASSAHVRPGCILEEHASCGHAVGLKQTVLLPYVTLGSLINFCDCLMSGGTDRKNHSEVGSSFVHFNFTPYNDKATASLFGNVPQGVMLDQDPVFLGGQAGAVGPIRLAHGCTLAAGSILRKDCIGPGNLIIEKGPPSTRLPITDTVKRNYRRITTSGLGYIGNILALREWYTAVRRPLSQANAFDKPCCDSAIKALDLILAERIQRLTDVLTGAKLHKTDLKTFRDQLDQLPDRIATVGQNQATRDDFTAYLGNPKETNYIDFIKEMPAEVRAQGTLWMQSIVDGVESLLS
jgi:hypothetical protein